MVAQYDTQRRSLAVLAVHGVLEHGLDLLAFRWGRIVFPVAVVLYFPEGQEIFHAIVKHAIQPIQMDGCTAAGQVQHEGLIRGMISVEAASQVRPVRRNAPPRGENGLIV